MRALLLTLALVLALAVPAAANAAFFCVADPGCPPGGIAQPNPSAAIEAADADATQDTVRIGPGEFSTGPMTANTEIDIVGAGREATTLVADPTVGGSLLYVFGAAGSSVSNLQLRLTEASTQALRLADGADASDLNIRADSSLTDADGIIAEDSGTDVSRADIMIGPDLAASNGFFAFDEAEISDSFIQAGLGISGADVQVTARRVHVRAGIGLRPFGTTLVISDSIVQPHPDDDFFYGASVHSGNPVFEGTGVLDATNLTIVGNGAPGSYGIRGDANDGDVLIGIANTVVTGVATSMLRTESLGTDDVDFVVRWSSFDASTAQLVNGPGSGTNTLVDNLDMAPDSRFVDAAAADFRLRHDSPLVDRGRPSPAPASSSDFRGLPRLRDGDADGTERVDIGAYEYQRAAPQPAFSYTPAQPLFGDAISFVSTASDVDGDPFSLSWDLGEGPPETASQASRVYSLPGTYNATLTATDVTGLSASTTQVVSVAARPGPCANPRVGSAAADHIAGLSAGDLLDGLDGDDTLDGHEGADCLFGRAGRDRLLGGRDADRLDGGTGADRLAGDAGKDRLGGGAGKDRLGGGAGNDRLAGGKGNDRLAGGAGRDRLAGGPGKDVLKPGKGRDSVTGGPGNDVLDLRGGGADTANCGAGKNDRVILGRGDRAKACERGGGRAP